MGSNLGSICRPGSILLPPFTSDMGKASKHTFDRNYEQHNRHEQKSARLKIASFHQILNRFGFKTLNSKSLPQGILQGIPMHGCHAPLSNLARRLSQNLRTL
jgi:hypothetical protein